MNKTIDPRLDELRAKQAAALLGGGQNRIDKQHAKGKMTARERIEMFLDAGTFQELQPFSIVVDAEKSLPGDGVVTGYGEVDGRTVYVYAQDFTVLGGSVSLVHARKIAQVQDLAMHNGVPIIGMLDSGGARIQEGILSLQGYGEIFKRNAMASGVVPQISVMLGPCAGGAAYSPALTDFIVMTEETSMVFITGPNVVKSVTGEEVSHQQLGGAQVHYTTSGVCHFVGRDEHDSLAITRQLLSYLPSNNVENPPVVSSNDSPQRTAEVLNSLIPEDQHVPYDMQEAIQRIVDQGTFFEVQAGWARNAIVGLARLDGHSIGIVAQQPLVMAGVLDINASDKIARFVRFCDAFNIPLVTLVDSPGFLPGVAQEHNGIIRHGAKILYAYIEASVPKISIVTRKAYGGAYIVLSSKSIGADLHLAWPSAEIAVMGPEGAVNIVNRRELAKAEDPVALRAQLVQAYRDKYANPYRAAEYGIIDNIIEPAATRPHLIAALRAIRNPSREIPAKKHGNMPV
ncbi:MAG: acyl-CoA carboxylase subunit beta [Chloroflexota bacterium]|nr:acyl-CoA carboxylase subunit beta [Chloroflexota bacterium]